MSTILEQLKVETYQLHKDVESVSGVDKILNHSITNSQFEKILEKNYIAYFETENEINKHLEYGWDISSWIKKDLKDHTPIYSEIEFSLNSKYEGYGAKYVLEGSLLGGNFISKHLKNCVKLKENATYQFYSNSDKSRIERWLNFKEELNSKQLSSSEIQQIINGAKKAFNNFKVIFSHQLVQP